MSPSRILLIQLLFVLNVYYAQSPPFPLWLCPALSPITSSELFLGPAAIFPNFLAVPRHVRLKISPHAVAGLHQPPQKKSFGENYMQGQSFLQSPRAPHQSLGVLFRYLVSGSGRGGARFFSHHPRGWRSTTAKLTWGHLCPRLPSGPPRMSSWNLNQNTQLVSRRSSAGGSQMASLL